MNKYRISITADIIIPQIYKILDDIQKNLYNQAYSFREKNTYKCTEYKEFKSLIKKGGFIKSYWDGKKDSESAIKLDTKATIRCILSKNIENKCIYSGKKSKYEVIFARAY